MNTWFLVASLALVPAPAAALDPLPRETEQAFYDGVHGYFECVDCHTDTTKAAIARNAIPAVCGECHPKVETDYGKSVHWASGKAEAVCIDCHGIHGIAPVNEAASKTYRSLVCGECHIGPMEHFVTGPHHAAFEKSGDLACASCHSNHAVLHPTVTVVEPACRTCHDEASAEFVFGQSVGDRFEIVRAGLINARQSVEQARSAGLDVRRAEGLVQTGHATYIQARLVWHGLDGEAIEATAQKAVQTVERAVEEIARTRRARATRITWLGVCWFVIFIVITLLAFKKRALDRADPPTG